MCVFIFYFRKINNILLDLKYHPCMIPKNKMVYITLAGYSPWKFPPEIISPVSANTI